MNKKALAQKIKALEGLSKEDKHDLLELLNAKTYGLVWEDKPEAVEEELKTQLPVLMEVTEKRIISLKQDLGINQDENVLIGLKDNQDSQDLKRTIKPQISLDFGTDENVLTGFKDFQDGQDLGENVKNPVHPVQSLNPVLTSSINHTLIEGDNLHALTVLNYTHANKIDVIYIDPPYNTGNKDFKYNDHFVDKEDGYRHSKWLSFMAKRLRLAKNLLSDKGVIFISIDDNEQAQLKLLCDEIFGEDNFLANTIWQKVYSPRMDAKGFSVSHDYILTYKKNPLGNIQKLSFEQNTKQFNSFDKKSGQFYRARSLRKDGSNSLRTDRPNLFYAIIAPDGQEIFPIKPDGKEGNWRWSPETYKKNVEEENVEWVQKNGKWDIMVKQWKSDDAQMPPPTLWLNNEVGHNHEAAEEIKNIFGESSFSTPKPLRLLKRIFEIGGFSNSTILDFFAGSGTTLHAVMALNAEDGGSRQCILVTNNENNICEEVTYERNKRVIEGYTNAKGESVAGLGGNNLRYYRTGYVGRERTIKNKKVLVNLATEMLCLKEGVYQEKKVGAGLKDLQDEKGRTGFKDLQDGQELVMDKKNPVYPDKSLNPVRLFEENDKAFMIIYDEEYIDEAVELIQQIEIPNAIKVYVFANGQYPYTEDFEEVLDKIELCALPDAIYRAYQRLLPKEEPTP